jgi:hypothetical protein
MFSRLLANKGGRGGGGGGGRTQQQAREEKEKSGRGLERSGRARGGGGGLWGVGGATLSIRYREILKALAKAEG